MIKILLILYLTLPCFGFSQTKPAPDPARIDLRSIGVAQVVQLLYGEILKDAYVIDPEVLTDQRTVSLRYDAKRGDVKPFIASFFDSLGLAITRRGGVDYVTKKIVTVPDPVEPETFVYRPRFRDGSYLVDLLAPLFKGSFTARKTMHAATGDKSPAQAVPPGSAAASIDRKSEMLVFAGTAAEIERLKAVLAQVDMSLGDVIVRGVLYEVQTSQNDGSAFSLALNLLGSRFGVGIGPVTKASASGNFLRLQNHSIDAVLSSLSADSRFTVRSTPSLRVASGATGRFTVGQDVPVLGAVSYSNTGGAPVRSVEYRSSGVIFDLQPVLHDAGVDLTVMQQVSNFVATDTGVNDSPTLIKREIRTGLTLMDGELVVIGGLAEQKETKARNGLGFLPDFLHSKTADKTQTEILLVLQLTKI